jgi:sirohydrochlorin cobaltochelatase
MNVCIGKPLLCDEPDLDAIIRMLQEAYPVDDDTILLLMGHGTEHAANDIYIRLAQKMRKLPMRLCTVEGTPSFDDAIEELTAQPQRKVQLAPMLFVAGDHAKNDMAGDEPDSLRSRLEAKGYIVSCAIQGLGELADVRNMYAQKAREALV